MGKRRGLEMETKIEQVGKRAEEVESRKRESSEEMAEVSCVEIGVVFGEEPLSFEFQSLGNTPGRSCGIFGCISLGTRRN